MASRFILPFANVGSGIKPSSGAKLFFFATGTNTPKDTFSDTSGTENTNPVVADSNGVFSNIFIDGVYKVILQDNNSVQMWEADPVTSVFTTSDIGVFYYDNVAEMKTKNLSVGQRVTLDKYRIDDDFVADLNYTIVAGTADGYVDHQLDNGLMAKLVFNELIDLKTAGLGTADDGPAINAGLNKAACTLSNGSYNVSTALDFKNSLIGIGSVIIQQVGFISNLGDFTTDNVTIDNVTFKGSLTDGVTEVTNHYLIIPESRKGIKIVNCGFTELKGVTSNQQYAVEVNLEDTDVEIINCSFTNIQQVGSNPPDEGVSPGFCGGIFCQNTNSSIVVPPRLRISNCYFADIETVRNPSAPADDLLDYDADAIRFFATEPDAEDLVLSDIIISNCNFHNVQKRCVKVTNINGLVIDGLVCSGLNTSDTTRPAMAAMVSLQPAQNCHISNVDATGKFFYLFRITGSDIKISNVKFNRGATGFLTYFVGLEERGAIKENNISIDGAQLLGCTRLYRAIDSSVGSGTRKYEVDNISVRNVDMSYYKDADDSDSVDVLLKLEDLKNALFQNINIYTDITTEINLKGISLKRCENVTFDAVKLNYSNTLLSVSDSTGGSRVTQNVTFKNCELKREGTVAPTTDAINLPDTAANFLLFRNIFYIQSTVSDSNHSLIRSDGVNTRLDGNTIEATQFSTNAFFPFSMLRFTESGAEIYNHTFRTDGTDASLMAQFFSDSMATAKVVNAHSDQVIVSITGTGQVIMNCSSDASIIASGGSFTANGNNLTY